MRRPLLLCFDRSLRITAFSGEPDQWLGLVPSTLVGASAAALGWTELEEQFQALLAGKPDGTVVRLPAGARPERPAQHAWREAVLVALRDAAGAITGGLLTVGVPEQHAQQQHEKLSRKLDEAEREARAVIEFSGDLHTTTDPDGRLLWGLANI